MSEKAPLIDTKSMPLGPKTGDYVKVILWPLLLALCGIALFAFMLAVPPIHKVTPYAVIALATMLLPIIPFITALNLVRSSSKKAGNVHFWVLVAVCALVACLTLCNDRVLSGADASSYFDEHSFTHKLSGEEIITDVSLAAILVTVVLGVLGAAAASSFIKKLDIPPLPINA